MTYQEFIQTKTKAHMPSGINAETIKAINEVKNEKTNASY